MTALEQRLETIEARLRDLEDEKAIQQVLYAYAHGLDYHVEDVFRDVWTEDAVLDRVSIYLEGRESIMTEYFDTHSGPPIAYHKHHVGVSRILLDGDVASAHSYAFRLNNLKGGPTVFAYGRYRDTLIRCSDDRWRIKHRLMDNEGMVPWDREDVAEFLALDNLQEQIAEGKLDPSAHARHLARTHGGGSQS